MADFESAATTLAAKSSECLEQTESIGHRLDELESSLQQSSEQLKSQASRLEEAFEEAAQKLSVVEVELTQRFDGFISNCSQLHDLIVDMRVSFQAQCEALGTSIEECHSAAKESSTEQDAAWQSLHSSASLLVDGCTGIQTLSASVATEVATQVMDQLGEALAVHEEKLTSEALELTDAIEGQGLSLLVGKSGEFASQLEAVGSQLRDGLQDTGTLVEQALTGNLESLTVSYEENVSAILEIVASLSDSLTDATDQIGDSIESVSNAFDVIDDVSNASNSGLRSALKVFEEAKELLERIV